MLAGIVFALALLIRVAVPTGFMPAMADGQLSVSVCSGDGPAEIVVTIPGLKPDKPSPHGGEKSCAFADLANPAVPAVDPVLLAAALLIVYIFVLFARTAPPAMRSARLRPPLRGPPSIS